MQCKCLKGYKSTWDNLCANCRTKEQQWLHSARMDAMMGYLVHIKNKHHGYSAGEYIGRGSPLGNPFVIGEDGTREEVIAKYKTYLEVQVQIGNALIINELDRLAYILMERKELTLICYCAPRPCHGQVIKDMLYQVLYDNCHPTK